MKNKKKQILELLVQMKNEMNDPKRWEDSIWGMSSKFAVRGFFNEYADKIDKVYNEKNN